MARALCLLVCVFGFGVAAANNDDGFIWLDANTRIKVLKPVSASAGETKAPEPKKEKKEKPRK